MKHWRIMFKRRGSVTITGTSFHKALLASQIKPFLVIEVESIIQIESN